MQDFAHLRFADDVFAVVQELQKLGTVEARDAREVFDGAPEGWFVVVMKADQPWDLIGIVAQACRGNSFADELLAAQIEPLGNRYMATFLQLRGHAETVH